MVEKLAKVGGGEVPDNELTPKDHTVKGLRTCQCLPSNELCGGKCSSLFL